MKGRLKDRPLEAVLGALRSRDASGVLTLELKPVKRQICLLRGFVCLAVSNLREERLGAYLVRHCVLPEALVSEVEKDAAAVVTERATAQTSARRPCGQGRCVDVK